MEAPRAAGDPDAVAGRIAGSRLHLLYDIAISRRGRGDGSAGAGTVGRTGVALAVGVAEGSASCSPPMICNATSTTAMDMTISERRRR